MTTITAPDGTDYLGFLDVSGWQFDYLGHGKISPSSSPPNLRKARDRGIVGVIARVGNGTSRDESFPLVYEAARSAGIAVGAYYYAQPNALRADEAAIWTMARLDGFPLDLPVMLDLEHYRGETLPPSVLGQWVRNYLEHVEQLSGRRPLLYAGAAFANGLTIAGSLADFDTVQPRYPRHGTRPPSVLGEWAEWIPWTSPPRFSSTLGPWEAWQFSSEAHWPDFGGPGDASTDRLDVNVVPRTVWNRWTRQTPEGPEMLHFTPERPGATRVLDTRRSPGSKVSDNVEVPAPSGAAAVSVTITVTQPDAAGYVSAWAEGDRPVSSVLNFHTNTTVANTTIVPVGADGKIRIASTCPTHLVVDLVGIWTDST